MVNNTTAHCFWCSCSYICLDASFNSKYSVFLFPKKHIVPANKENKCNDTLTSILDRAIFIIMHLHANSSSSDYLEVFYVVTYFQIDDKSMLQLESYILKIENVIDCVGGHKQDNDTVLLLSRVYCILHESGLVRVLLRSVCGRPVPAVI